MKCWQVVHLSTSSALQRILTKILKIIYFTVQFHLILCYYNICFVEKHESIVVLKGFLNKNPADRLGCRKETGFVDIVHHPFFKSVDWEMV